jgi:LmbE family N-acetylglucosaminyl deacetylase
MRWIYISPHLDDAVLSAGGLIFEQTRAGIPVEIWTMMCGYPPEGELSPFAQALHTMWKTSSAEETIRIRRLEDVEAAARVGATTRHFDFLDCIYRRGDSGDWLYADIYVSPHPDEPGLPRQIADAIAAGLQPDDVVVCQLALGPHIDHLTVRMAVELLDRPLVYDADIPYLFNFPGQLAPQTAGMQEQVHAVSAVGLERWGDGVAAYESQISMLFESPERMRQALADYCAGHGGIRLWQRRT